MFGLVKFLFAGSAIFLVFGILDYLFCRISGNNLDLPAYRVAFFAIFSILVIFFAWRFLGLPMRGRISRLSIAERFADRQPRSGRFDKRYLIAAVDFTEHPPAGHITLEEYIIEKAGETDFTVKIFDPLEETNAFWALGILVVLWCFAFCVFSGPTKTAVGRIFLPFAEIHWLHTEMPPENAIEKPIIHVVENPEHIEISKLTAAESAGMYRHYLSIIRDELHRALLMQGENRERLAGKADVEVVSLRYWQREIRKLLTDENSGIPHYFPPIRAAILAGEDESSEAESRAKLLDAIEAGIGQLEQEQLFPLEVLFSDWSRNTSVTVRPESGLVEEILFRERNVELAIEKMLDLIENWENEESLRLEWGALFAKQAALYLRSKSELSETLGLTVSELSPGRRQLLQAMSKEQRAIAEKITDLVASVGTFSEGIFDNAENSALAIDRNRLGNSMREQRELLRFFMILAKDAPQVEEFSPLLLADSSQSGGGPSGLTEWLIDPAVGEDSQPEKVETDHALTQGNGTTEPGNPDDPGSKQTGETGSGTGGGADETAGRTNVVRDGSAGKFDLRKQWGELPERLRRELPEPPKEEPLPQYREAVERYYHELIEKNKKEPQGARKIG